MVTGLVEPLPFAANDLSKDIGQSSCAATGGKPMPKRTVRRLSMLRALAGRLVVGPLMRPAGNFHQTKLSMTES